MNWVGSLFILTYQMYAQGGEFPAGTDFLLLSGEDFMLLDTTNLLLLGL